MTDYFSKQENINCLLQVEPYSIEHAKSHHIQSDPPLPAVNINSLIKAQTHLFDEQQQDLAQVLKKYYNLFEGKLGTYTKRTFCNDIIPGSIPYHCNCPYCANQHEKCLERRIRLTKPCFR